MVNRNVIHRFRKILKVLAHYGFGYVLNSKGERNNSPQNLRKAFEELGPTFIKIGQILSTRPDILSKEYIEELQKLQDDTPSIGYNEVEQTFFNEFGENIEDVFSSFDKIPLASASIAQAHRASIKTGDTVIVKIQRPGIERDMELDISILKKVVHLTGGRFISNLINPAEALDEILSYTRKELDFRSEAESIKRFYELNRNIRFVGVPEVIWDLTSKEIITMTYIDGIKITDTETLLKEGYNLKDIARKLAISYFKQIFEDGFFHGDPHPGNMLVKGGKIYYIDFGIMGNLSNSMKSALHEILLSIAYRDIDRMIAALLSIGIKKGIVNRNKLYEDLDYLFNNYLSVSFENIQISKLLQDTLDTSKRNNLRLPGELTLLIRSVVIIEGVITKISPDIKLLDIAIPYIKSTSKIDMEQTLNQFLIGGYSFIKDSMEIPSRFLKLSNAMLNGRAKLQLEHRHLSKHVQQLNKMVNRLVFAIIVSSLIIGSSLIINTNAGPKLYNLSIIGVVGFLVAAFMGLWLIISILRSGKL